MPEYVRVRVQESGAEVTVGASFAESSDGLEVLDEPAVDRVGRPLPTTRRGGRPMKPSTTVEQEAAKKRGQRADAAPQTPADTTAAGPTDGGSSADPA